MRKIKIIPIDKKDQVSVIFNRYLNELSKYDSDIEFDSFGNPIYPYF